MQEQSIVNRHGPKPRSRSDTTNPITPMSFKGTPTRKLSDFPQLRNLKPSLTWAKVHHPTKGYRLTWEFMGKVVWCGENEIVYKRVHDKGGVVEAGEQLAGLLGVNFKK